MNATRSCICRANADPLRSFQTHHPIAAEGSAKTKEFDEDVETMSPEAIAKLSQQVNSKRSHQNIDLSILHVRMKLIFVCLPHPCRNAVISLSF